MEHYKSWGELKKWLEGNLCPRLKGRVTFFLTKYHKVHDAYGRAAIAVDGEERAVFTWHNRCIQEWDSDQMWLDSGKKSYDTVGYKEALKPKWDAGCLYCEDDFLSAVLTFRNMSVKEALASDNFLIKTLAILDSRVGTRTLDRIRLSGEHLGYPEWVRGFFLLRLEDDKNRKQNTTINNKVNKEMIMKEQFVIENEKESEQFEVEAMVRDSFWNVYRPGALEHFVLHQMRKDDGFVRELNFVLKLDGKIIGQNVFYRTFITTDEGEKYPILTMGPISIANDYKRKGYGKILLDYCLEKASEMGFGAVCFEGNIDFYGKSGFSFARSFGIGYHGLPEGEDDSFFLCKELKTGYLSNIKGEYQTPDVYLVDEAHAEEFDKQFPEKQKLKLPTQIF